MFRLEVLGDFDLNELEGLNPRINASLVPFNIFKGNPGRISGTIEDGEHNRYYHQGVSASKRPLERPLLRYTGRVRHPVDYGHGGSDERLRWTS